MSITRPIILSFSISCLIHGLIILLLATFFLHHQAIIQKTNKKMNVRLVSAVAEHKTADEQSTFSIIKDLPTSSDLMSQKKETSFPPKNIKKKNSTIESVSSAVDSAAPDHKGEQMPIAATNNRKNPLELSNSVPSQITLSSQGYYQQAMLNQQAQAKSYQLQQRYLHLNKLTESWPNFVDSFEAKCWLESRESTTFECSSNEIKQVIGSNENEVIAIVKSINALGTPAIGIHISYRQLHYDVSIISSQ